MKWTLLQLKQQFAEKNGKVAGRKRELIVS